MAKNAIFHPSVHENANSVHGGGPSGSYELPQLRTLKIWPKSDIFIISWPFYEISYLMTSSSNPESGEYGLLNENPKVDNFHTFSDLKTWDFLWPFLQFPENPKTRFKTNEIGVCLHWRKKYSTFLSVFNEISHKRSKTSWFLQKIPQIQISIGIFLPKNTDF